MAKKSVYFVFKGRKTGVFNSWPKCHEQVDGFTGAAYQKFNTVNKAYEAIRSRAIKSENHSIDISGTREDKVINFSKQHFIINNQASNICMLFTNGVLYICNTFPQTLEDRFQPVCFISSNSGIVHRDVEEGVEMLDVPSVSASLQSADVFLSLLYSSSSFVSKVSEKSESSNSSSKCLLVDAGVL
ncbi:hypothetical protein Ddye_021164 [Dipteronia dyeriana]|uniref:Ribonuclease H1 N-terminal domain-containing protein n=1 Tax=Dipteronia dyeriana TaxID=168575 RepID=A0AAD9U139_9ROSI|nr:hypothetical protein Ddye_021164 [Dipteronia dyeriana]